MNKLAIKFGAGLAAASLFAASAMPTFAAINIVGNGPFSFNAVSLTKNWTKTTTQTNTAVFVNGVTTTSSSGGNTSAFNTGGSNLVLTGGSTTTVHIVNVANSNVIN